MTKHASSRAPRPPPLNIGVARAFTAPSASGSRASATSEKSSRCNSSDSANMPTWSAHHRTGSEVSNTSTSSHASSKKAPTSPNVNVYTTCGRHSNQWLFSGWGFSKKH